MLKRIINYPFHLIGFHLTLSSGFFGISLRKLSELKKRQAVIEAEKLFIDKEIIACEIGVFKGEHTYQILKNLNI